MKGGIPYNYFREKYVYSEGKDLLGTGGFGSVYKAKDIHINRMVAIKYYKGESSAYDVVSEVRKAIQLKHRNLVEYYGADYIINKIIEKDEHGEKEVIQQDQIAIMQYINGGNLNNFLSKNKDLIAQTPEIFDRLLLDILYGLKKLEDNGVIHGDIKPQNILIKNTGTAFIAKIADFGLSSKSESYEDYQSKGKSKTVLGSPPFVAPELMDPNYGIREKGKMVKKANVDLWAIGVILYWLLIGEHPFGPISANMHPTFLLKNILINPLPKILIKSLKNIKISLGNAS